MFFYSESDYTEIIVISTGSLSNALSSTALNLSGAEDGDLLVVSTFNTSDYSTANTFLSSSLSNNWYTLANTVTSSVDLNYIGSIQKISVNCSNSNTGTSITSHYGTIRLIMKKITAAEISSGVTIRCSQNSSIQYMLMRGVTNYSTHKNSSGSLITSQISSDRFSSTKNLTWPVTNTNINDNTQNLFIIGWNVAGSTSVPSATTTISSGGRYFFKLDKQNLTGSSVPYTASRSGGASSFLYNSNTIYNPWASYIGFIVS
jgi:hypothetical protein